MPPGSKHCFPRLERRGRVDELVINIFYIRGIVRSVSHVCILGQTSRVAPGLVFLTHLISQLGSKDLYIFRQNLHNMLTRWTTQVTKRPWPSVLRIFIRPILQSGTQYTEVSSPIYIVRIWVRILHLTVAGPLQADSRVKGNCCWNCRPSSNSWSTYRSSQPYTLIPQIWSQVQWPS